VKFFELTEVFFWTEKHVFVKDAQLRFFQTLKKEKTRQRSQSTSNQYNAWRWRMKVVNSIYAFQHLNLVQLSDFPPPPNPFVSFFLVVKKRR